MHQDPWPIGAVPWPNLRKSKVPSDRVKMFDFLDHEAVFAVGPVRGIPLRVGRSKDPRETWTRLQKASAVQLYVHSLSWVPARLALGILDSAVAGIAAHQLPGDRMWFDTDVASFDKLIADASSQRGVQAIDHVRFVTDLESTTRRHRDEKQARLDADARQRAERREIAI